MMPVWLPDLLVFAGAIATGAISAWAVVWKTKREMKSASIEAEAQVQQAINDGFHKLTERLQAEVDRAQTELTTTRAQISELEGWIRDLIQHIESLERLLSTQGIDIPERAFARVVKLGRPA